MHLFNVLPTNVCILIYFILLQPLELLQSLVIQLLSKPIHVNLPRVGQIHNAVKSMAKQSVHVFRDILELLQHVDQNVSLALSVLKTRLATIRNALILVQELVA
jgi:hypothetical protein